MFYIPKRTQIKHTSVLISPKFISGSRICNFFKYMNVLLTSSITIYSLEDHSQDLVADV